MSCAIEGRWPCAKRHDAQVAELALGRRLFLALLLNVGRPANKSGPLAHRRQSRSVLGANEQRRDEQAVAQRHCADCEGKAQRFVILIDCHIHSADRRLVARGLVVYPCNFATPAHTDNAMLAPTTQSQ
jgi:hypothetical protein